MADPTEEEKVRRMISDALSLNTLEAASAADLRRLEQAILSAIAAEREKAAKWQPIETAPKDGRKILGYPVFGNVGTRHL